MLNESKRMKSLQGNLRILSLESIVPIVRILIVKSNEDMFDRALSSLHYGCGEVNPTASEIIQCQSTDGSLQKLN